MTEHEVLTLQQQTGRFYVVMMGPFYHAYDGAAFALARVMGYQIHRKHRKSGPLCQLGFGVAQMGKVRECCARQGIVLQPEDQRGMLFSFVGGDPTPDESLVSISKPRRQQPSPDFFSAPLGAAQEQPRQSDRRQASDPTRIYAKSVQLQHLTMRILVSNSEMSRKFRYTVVPELLKMATRLMEQADLLELDFGEQRMNRAKQIAALVRTYATTVGNLRLLDGLSPGTEGDIALLVEAIESEAKAAWWESHNKEIGQSRNPSGYRVQTE